VTVKHVRCLSRGLEVLRALNESNYSSVSEISRMTGLPRATVYRLLETMVTEGYVARNSDEDIYSLCAATRNLTSGLSDNALATDLVRPLAEELSKEIVWPIDVTTFDGHRMRVCFSTHGRSPRSLLGRSSVGHSLPLVGTATGRAFLASLPVAQREPIIQEVMKEPQECCPVLRSDVDRLIRRAEELGYGFRNGGSIPRTSAIALPIRSKGRPVACVSAMFIKSAVSLDDAASRYLGPMHAVVRRVEAQLEAA
jgi:IclR family mhp operon transcriptional activator